ncbi:MAG: hypothetical protein IPK13_14525 [Deltaproteobacteria bacterium]|nr:hypothetical protein [Deltaproteobacteria bacterium]
MTAMRRGQHPEPQDLGRAPGMASHHKHPGCRTLCYRPRPRKHAPHLCVRRVRATRLAFAMVLGVAVSAKQSKAANPTHQEIPREATRAEAESLLRTLENTVDAEVRDVHNAWILAHGVVAFGPKLTASDGRPVVDVIVHDFAMVSHDRSANRKRSRNRGRSRGRSRNGNGNRDHAKTDVEAGVLIEFPRSTKEGIPIEPHRMLVTKALVDAGVSPTRRFVLSTGDTVTLAKLVDDGARSLAFPKTEEDFRGIGWGLLALLMTHELDATIALADGGRSLRDLWLASLAELERLQSFLVEPMRAQRPDLVEKRKQGIFAHTCGGTHLIQAVAYGTAQSRDPAASRRLREQLEILLFRFDAERRIYDRMIAAQPRYAAPLLIQKLKFSGHFLETLALAHSWGVFRPSPTEIRTIRAAVRDLANTTEALRSAYANLPKLKKTAPQAYFDLVGDTCHAIRGLRLSVVAFFSP